MPEVKCVTSPGAVLPSYQTKGAAGADICACIETDVVIGVGERVMVPTGLFFEIPQGYEVQVRPRSGLALKYGISVCNTPGTIDQKYSDEIGVILINLGEEQFTVNPGDRIAQLVFKKVEKAELIEVDSFKTEDDRGGGYGHSGIK